MDRVIPLFHQLVNGLDRTDKVTAPLSGWSLCSDTAAIEQLCFFHDAYIIYTIDLRT